MTLVVSSLNCRGWDSCVETIKKVTCRFLAAVKRVVPWICFSTKGCGSHANCEFFPKYSSLLSKKSAQPSKIFAKLSRKRSVWNWTEPRNSQNCIHMRNLESNVAAYPSSCPQDAISSEFQRVSSYVHRADEWEMNIKPYIPHWGKIRFFSHKLKLGSKCDFLKFLSYYWKSNSGLCAKI